MSHLKQRELLRKLQEVDFVLVELNLYLDTHPRDIQALEQFNDFAEKRREIAEKYEERYGPLMNFGHSTIAYDQRWTQGPWPWEL